MKNTNLQSLGIIFGYIVSYLLFTTTVFFVFMFLKKMPLGWTIFHFAGITVFISVLALIVKRLIK